MKILLAVDGSSFTRQMLAYLGAHEEWLGKANAHTVFHALAPLPHGLEAVMSDDEMRTRYDRDAEAVFRPVRHFLQQHGIDARFEHRVGDPGRLIAERATEGGFDLVMIGSHGHGALGNVVLGSVATKVLALCQVPALVIRHAEA